MTIKEYMRQNGKCKIIPDKSLLGFNTKAEGNTIRLSEKLFSVLCEHIDNQLSDIDFWSSIKITV
jgi:hypothetical protein